MGTFGLLALVMCLATSSCKLTNPPKIMIVMMENKDFSEVIGNSALPYTNRLASHYGLATQSYSISHISPANYFELISGSTQGVTGDGPPSSYSFSGVPTLADQLLSEGVRVAAFAENLPTNPTKDSGLYLVRHNPWEYFPSTPITVKDSPALIPELNGASPPDFVWYTPNITNDGHTGVPADTQATELADTEAFLSRFIPSVQATSWYKSGGQIIIEWDEALASDTSGVNGGRGGHVPTIVVSQALAAHPQQYSGKVGPAGILHSIELVYLASYLGDAGNAANGNIDSLIYF